jgi:hypothetical protein
MEIALISEELFRLNSPIKDDTYIGKFVPYIILTQKMYIKPFLGSALYNELQTQIKAAQVVPTPDPYPISEANQALLEMIAPPLSFYAVYQGLPFHWAAIVNKGVTLRNSENSDAVGINDIAQLRRWIKDDAQELMNQLTGYLCGCDKYPLWVPGTHCGGCGCGDSTAAANDFGIFIPRRK